MTERMKVVVNDDELRALTPLLDELILKKKLIMGWGFERLDEVQSVADAVEAEVQATVDRLTAEILAVQTLAIETEMSLKEAFMDMDLPTVDRATRMILLRVPGIREALRMLYAISMLQRTLALGDMRGPITALIVSLMYITMTMQQLEKRQLRLEQQMAEFTRITTQRFITMEEALRNYDRRPETYRATVIP